MKIIKKLNIKTLHGIEFKNVKRFPSHEWGDNGGCSADLYFKDTLVAHFFDKGEGGMPHVDWVCDLPTQIDVNTECLRVLKRYVPEYTKYAYLKDKTPAKINEDDIGYLEGFMESLHDSKQRMTL